MVVLNLYPKGTLEYDDKEIRSTGLNNSVVIPIEDVLNIEFKDASRLQNGNIKIRARNRSIDLQCIFSKKRSDDAKIAYNDLIELTKNNDKSNILSCPVCNTTMYPTKSTGFLSVGIDYVCSNCELKFNLIDENYTLTDAKEKTRMFIYKNKKYSWDEWIKICSGHFSVDEEKELSKLILEENTNIPCPICDNYLDKYHKKGILSFDSLICSNCNSRFEILADKYRFINSPNNNNKLWEVYKENLDMNEFYNIMGKSNLINEEKQADDNIIEDSNNNFIEETNEIQEQPSLNLNYCPYCGEKIIQNAKFCIVCGNSFSQFTNKIEENNKEESINTTVPKKENNQEETDDFLKNLYSHNLIQSNINCPSCDNTMKTYTESGRLSKKTYHACEKCRLILEKNNNTYVIQEAPSNTKLDKKLRFKNLTLETWKDLFNSNYTDEENDKIRSLNIVEPTSYSCPACNDSLVKYKSEGFRSSNYLLCPTCLILLKEHKNNQYTLENARDIYSPLWKYENDKLTLNEIQQIYETDKSYLEERKQHLQKVKKSKQEVENFLNDLENGKVTLATPITTTIVLKKQEIPIFKVNDVILSEPRAVRTTSGGYSGASVKISKGVTLHAGSTEHKSESHDEIKIIDNGELLVTNKRLIFLGTKRTTNIDLNKIIAITEEEDIITIQRSNKQKPEYFSNIQSTQKFKVGTNELEVTIGGTLLKKIILGQLQA